MNHSLTSTNTLLAMIILTDIDSTYILGAQGLVALYFQNCWTMYQLSIIVEAVSYINPILFYQPTPSTF